MLTPLRFFRYEAEPSAHAKPSLEPFAQKASVTVTLLVGELVEGAGAAAEVGAEAEVVFRLIHRL